MPYPNKAAATQFQLVVVVLEQPSSAAPSTYYNIKSGVSNMNIQFRYIHYHTMQAKRKTPEYFSQKATSVQFRHWLISFF